MEYNFLEAVDRLSDGDCEKIQHEDSGATYVLDGRGVLVYDKSLKGINLKPEFYLGWWILVGEKKAKPTCFTSIEHVICKVEEWRDEVAKDLEESITTNNALRAIGRKSAFLKVTKLLESIRDNNL